MILYYHCFAGISGDMNLAAMIDLGVPEKYLIDELGKLNIDGYSIKTKAAEKLGISGTQVDVELTHDNSHEHGHGHGHGHHHHREHHHRTFKIIKELINASPLDQKVKETSISIFEKVAIAEGKVHNKPPGEVHFHEVGAVDSIVDIVGAAICYHYLKPQKVMCSTVELGGGFVKCAHGTYPVPAPATAEIIQNMPISKGTVQFETTTPTGAAILATIVDEYADNFKLSISKTAYGIGHRDLEIPNVLRVYEAEDSTKKNISKSEALIIECNIDDMPGEQIGFVLETLMDNGAHDAFISPVIMKKSRPANKISVLCKHDQEEQFTRILLEQTSTLGVRSYPVHKTMLDRTITKVETKYGTIEVKSAWMDGKAIKHKPEFDQCREAALTNNVSLAEINQEVFSAVKKMKDEGRIA